MDQLVQMASGQAAKTADEKTGLSEGLAAQVMPMAMAVLMKGLKGNAASAQGAEALASALDNHDGAVVDDPTALQNDDVLADGQKILGHILGGKQAETERQLAQVAGGIDQSQISSILAMAAPAVLGALGKAKREQGLSASDLAGMLNSEAKEVEGKVPAQLGGVLSMLDADGDGNLNNEAMGLGKRLLGGLFGRK
ncbi:MAG: DUF937 domain-containing protein [Pseudomonadota bacterium]